MSENNFSDFVINVLRGIGYGNISSTNRAYKWILYNVHLKGDCVNFLKKNISPENLVTLDDLNTYKQLENQGSLPLEDEIDDLLQEYINETTSVFKHAEFQYVENELRFWKDFSEALQLEQKCLKRQCTKLEDKIISLELRKPTDINKIENILTLVEEKSILYGGVVEQVQHDLSDVTLMLSKLLNENDFMAKHNILRMNFEVLKVINNTFCEAVNTAINKQFYENFEIRQPESEEKKCFHFEEICDNALINTNILDVDQHKIEELISVAQCLGHYNYLLMKWRCEETELNELCQYVEDLLDKPKCKTLDIAKLKSLTDRNFETTYDLQKKIISLSETLEAYFDNNIVEDLLVRSRSRLENSLKVERQFMKNMSDLSTKFLNLMTLQGCLSLRELQNIDRTIDSHKYGRSKLNDQLQKHVSTMSNLEKILQRQQMIQLHNDSRKSMIDCNHDSNHLDKICIATNGVMTEKSKMLSFTDSGFDKFFHINSQLDDIIEFVYNGPVHQAFYCNSLLNDEQFITKQYIAFNDQYNSWKLKYIEELEKLNVDEYEKLQKSLAVMFLTEPESVKDNFERLKTQLSERSLKFSKTMIPSSGNIVPEIVSKLPQRKNLSTF